MAWIESHQALAAHPKTRKLARALGVRVPETVGYLHMLWWWALDYAPDGDLARWDATDIADAVMWDGDHSVFLQGLVTAGFVDTDGPEDARALHDWEQYTKNFRAVVTRAEQQRESARTRQRRKRDEGVTRSEQVRDEGVTSSEQVRDEGVTLARDRAQTDRPRPTETRPAAAAARVGACEHGEGPGCSFCGEPAPSSQQPAASEEPPPWADLEGLRLGMFEELRGYFLGRFDFDESLLEGLAQICRDNEPAEVRRALRECTRVSQAEGKGKVLPWPKNLSRFLVGDERPATSGQQWSRAGPGDSGSLSIADLKRAGVVRG